MDSGELVELKQQFAIEGIDLRLLFVLLLRQGITRGGDVLRGEAEIDIAHLVEAAQEKTGGKVFYNYEFIESFPSEERPGASVFYKNAAGEIFHTYSTYGRGLDILIGTYHFLDLAPKGRDEDALAWSMAWVRHHDRYDGAVVDAKASYQEPKSASCCE